MPGCQASQKEKKIDYFAHEKRKSRKQVKMILSKLA
jgi:hypothetical protein